MPVPTSGVRGWCVLMRRAAGATHFRNRMVGSITGSLGQECSVAVLCKERELIFCDEPDLQDASSASGSWRESDDEPSFLIRGTRECSVAALRGMAKRYGLNKKLSAALPYSIYIHRAL